MDGYNNPCLVAVFYHCDLRGWLDYMRRVFMKFITLLMDCLAICAAVLGIALILIGLGY